MTTFYKETAKGFTIKAAHKLESGSTGSTRFIEGVAYTIDSVRDRHGDLFAEGAFDASIVAFNEGQLSTKMRDHHGVTVGSWTGIEMIGAELVVKGSLLPTDPGKDLAVLIDGGAVDKLSIGIDETRSTWELLSDPPGRLWTSVWLVEISPVTFPAKENTSITSFKGAEATRLGVPQHGRSFAIMLGAAIAAKGIADGEGQATTVERLGIAAGLEIIDVYALLIEDHPVRPSRATIRTLGDQLAPSSDDFMTAALADGFVYMDEHDEPASDTTQTTATTSPVTTVSISIETKGAPPMTEKIDVVEPIAVVIDPRDEQIKALEIKLFTKSFDSAVLARKCAPSDKPRLQRLFERAGLDMALEFIDGATPRDDLASTTVGSSTAGIATKSAEPADDGLYAARVAVKNGFITKASFDRYVANR